MITNRLIFVAAIIGSALFASYYGGNISYALFYLTILIPVIAFLYTLYVYFRFKIYQSMEAYLVVKGDWTTYSFAIANEDYITFRNVKVKFLSDKSTIEEAHEMTEYSLLPNDSERMETRIKCNYRGEYYVGVDSIEVTDFLYLFRITYPILSKLKVVVLPRVVQLDRLGIAPPQPDVKNPMNFSNAAEEALDTEVRKYLPGDSRKRIHWKASARMGELISRKYQHIPKAEIVLFMDLTQVREEELKVIRTEDKIIESVLAITNFYALRSTPSQIIYDMEGRQEVFITARGDFNAFYKACARIQFEAKLTVSELMKLRLQRGDTGIFCVLVTHTLSRELYLTALQAISGGNYVSILYISDDTSDASGKLIDSMKLSGIAVHQVMLSDEIAEVLTREIRVL